jgi:hypothetical protein
MNTNFHLLIFHSSSVTPHPMMNKLQAHLSLSPSSHNHLKIKQNILFSPPSKIMSNYANFGSATNKPHWHLPADSIRPSGQYHYVNDNRHVHQHYHPEAQKQQQHQHQMAEVHPSILTPFIEQIQLKQKEVDQQKKHHQQQIQGSVKILSHDNTHVTTSNSNNNNNNNNNYEKEKEIENFEMINDVFSKHLVPPPPSIKPTVFSSGHHDAPSSTVNKKKQEKLNKFNLSMKSPLQDASRFNYENVVSTNRPSTPNVFVHLNNRTKDNAYKHHKQLHPAYKKKPFLPTPYEPEKQSEEIVLNGGYEPQHTFFTIEDAVTPNIAPSKNKFRDQIPVDEHIYEHQKVRQTTPRTTTSTTISSNINDLYEPTSTESSLKSTLKPRQKLRRRKQKPKHQQTENNVNNDGSEVTLKTKGKLSEIDENVLKTRNKINHPIRTRNKFNTQSTSPSTLSTSNEDEKSVELTTVTTHTSESSKQSEIFDPNNNQKRRVRIKFRNKLRTTTTDPAEAYDSDSKHADNQISETENEDFAINSKIASETSTIPTTAYSGLILPKLKFKNEIFTTFPTTASESSSTPTAPGSTASIESIPSKIPRPRFSIKEIKRKQLAQSVSPTTQTTTTTTTVSTSTTPDGQRFNRFRASFNRKRNETTLESAEENQIEKKKIFTLRTSPSSSIATATVTTTTVTSPTTTESSVLTSSINSRRNTLPKRTFPARNITRTPATEVEISSTAKPSRSTAITSRGNFRAKLKKKGPENEISLQSTTSSSSSTIDLEQNNHHHQFEDRRETVYSATSTEAPYKHETSIMKIAKTPSSVSKSSNIIENDFDQPSLATPDNDLNVSPSEHLQRVVELTLSGNDNDNNNFKSANIGNGALSRRIPNYFTISTDDPILPIQAFFPQINTNE